MASLMEQKITPFSAKVFLNVVATETESTIMSMATPLKRFCSFRLIPNFSKVLSSSGSTSSRLLICFFTGAA